MHPTLQRALDVLQEHGREDLAEGVEGVVRELEAEAGRIHDAYAERCERVGVERERLYDAEQERDRLREKGQALHDACMEWWSNMAPNIRDALRAWEAEEE